MSTKSIISQDAFLSKQQTLFYKGIAILCILLHNFFHFVRPVRYENEFNFLASRGDIFINEFSLTESFNAIFSFFGFYGVYVFVFLSGYGLTKSFLFNPEKKYLFVLRHIVKVYCLFLFSAFIFILYSQGNVDYKSLLYSLLLVHNFSMATMFIPVGPWWFFSLIIQLYLLFLPLFFLIKKSLYFFFYISLCVFIFAYYVLYFSGYDSVFFANSFAHIPEFSLGILIALYEKDFIFLRNRKIYLYSAIIALLIIFSAQYLKCIFVFSYIASAILPFCLFKYFNRQKNLFLEFSGKISPYLFVFNGFLFRFSFVSLANETSMFYLKIFYCLIWIVVNYLFAYYIYFFSKKILDK